MGILGRVSSLIKSNVNDLISRMTDPAKEVDLLIDDMEESAKKARLEVKGCLAEEKRLQIQLVRQREEVDIWKQRAADAVRSNSDELAKQALRKSAELEHQAGETEKAVAQQRTYVDELTASLKVLDQRVADVKLRRGTLKQQARMNKGAGLGEGAGQGASAFGEFERLASRIDQIEAEAEVDREMAAQDGKDPDAERKLRELAHKTSVDDALAELKKKLNQ